MLKAFFLFGFVVCFTLFGSFSRAQAYIDPASTSYMLELIIGLVVMGGAAAGYYLRKLKNKMRKKDTEVENISVEDQLSGIDEEEE